MPGALIALPAADHVLKIVPKGYPVVLWSLMLGISFAWYFIISYLLIKTYRLIVH